jgi:hypothetical protein
MLRAAAVVGNAGVADFERGSRETLDGRTRSLCGARHCTGGAREPRAARRQRRQGARALCHGRVEHSRLLCNEGECDASAVIAVGAFALPRSDLAHPSCRKRRLPRAKVSTDHQRQHIRDARAKRRERCDRLGLERRLAARQLRPGPQARSSSSCRADLPAALKSNFELAYQALEVIDRLEVKASKAAAAVLAADEVISELARLSAASGEN